MAKNSQEILDELQNKNDSAEEQKQENSSAPSNEEQKKETESPSNSSSVFDVFNDYKPEDGEDKLYHVAIAKVHYDESTGEYDGQKPYVQKFIKRDYDNFMKHAKCLGYQTKLLYSPINA